jgi:hypothetical protein
MMGTGESLVFNFLCPFCPHFQHPPVNRLAVGISKFPLRFRISTAVNPDSKKKIS